MKKGDKVSILDENLRGIINSIEGEYIEVEDEHGFLYSFHSSKLVPEIGSIYEGISIVKREEKAKNISKKHQKNEMKIDLHFDKLVEFPEKYNSWERIFIQREKLIEVLDYCNANSIKKLLIIHGLGDGILQDIVYDTLRNYAHTIEYEENEFFKHSSASIEVKFI